MSLLTDSKKRLATRNRAPAGVVSRRIMASFPGTPQVHAITTQVICELLGVPYAKRAQPTDDLLSGLTASDLTDEELVNIGFTLPGSTRPPT